MLLKPKKSGADANPNGRPKGIFSLKRALEGKLSEVNMRDMNRRTYGQCLVDRAIDIALKGRSSNTQVRAIADILDRAFGKPVQAVAMADLRSESREQMINSILEHARGEQAAESDDEPATIQ